MEACSLLVNLRKGMQRSSEQPLVGVEHCVTTLITAARCALQEENSPSKTLFIFQAFGHLTEHFL